MEITPIANLAKKENNAYWVKRSQKRKFRTNAGGTACPFKNGMVGGSDCYNTCVSLPCSDVYYSFADMCTNE